ncbi:hypothetical protein ALC60_11787 [Trachymyrmex zeteki]|uniref:Uncharacterized protein n=1 Tax=Mycetomoellerius zeteki TaxID=64791 RepID=A0A151WMW0_9HYME|nr:hypothetical protein ALC60_11787 [Trachymyrmex zeteki]
MFISFGQHWSKRILVNDINYHLERVVLCVTVCLWRLEKKAPRRAARRTPIVRSEHVDDDNDATPVLICHFALIKREDEPC